MAEAEKSLFRVPPHNHEAEQAVLGGLMLDTQAFDRITDLVTGEDFYRASHQSIFQAVGELSQDNHPIDAITVSQWLSAHNLLEAAGGLSYLNQLVSSTPSAANIRAYAEILRDHAIMRRLMAAGTEISEMACDPQGRASADVLDEAEQKVFRIAEERPSQGAPQPLNKVLTHTLARIEQMFESKSGLTGITTGFEQLDQKTSGLQHSDLVIVAGRPSMGKTSFAMNLVENALLMAEVPVLVFSMEMPADSLAMRMISSLGRIEQGRVRSGQLDEEDWPRLSSAVQLLRDANLYIDDTGSLTPLELRSRARRVVRELGGKIGLIMVDYLQLMRVPGFREGRTAEISEISRSLKALAKEMDCPVVALSQLNRSLEQRPNKRPVNSDLRESGAIEQDADVILFIYRDEVYNEDSPDKGVAEIIIGKQRNGPIGTVRLAFLGKYTRFDDMAPEYRQDPGL